MGNWLYSVWFKDHDLEPEDEDYEWCACFVIEASNPGDAKEWGDTLSRMYAADEVDEFVKSDVVKFIRDNFGDNTALPFVKFGYYASREEIGW